MGRGGVITGFIEVHNSGSTMITWPGQYPASKKMCVSDEKEDLIFDINPRPPFLKTQILFYIFKYPLVHISTTSSRLMADNSDPTFETLARGCQ